MAKLAQTSVKYLIKAKFEASGFVERPDVIGAIFGQTEGLLGPELDLRELQRTGRVGRIEVIVNYDKGKSEGEIQVPTSLDSTETVLIAAALETIERIGPCNAKITIEKVEDLRTVKRKYVIERAKELLQDLLSQIPEPSQITEDLMQSVRVNEITEYRGLPAGPAIFESDKIIVVEGRADVINLLKHGVRNVIGMDGTNVPPAIVELSHQKEVTVLLDGDRGGDLILKELLAKADIDYVARAPRGKEVEELTKKEIFKALRDAVPVEEARPLFEKHYGKEEHRQRYEENKREQPQQQEQKFTKKRGNREMQVKKEETMNISELPEDFKKALKEEAEDIIGTRAASIYNENLEFVGRVPVKELSSALTQVETPGIVVMDYPLDKQMFELLKKYGVRLVVATEINVNPSKTRMKATSMEELKNIQ